MKASCLCKLQAPLQGHDELCSLAQHFFLPQKSRRRIDWSVPCVPRVTRSLP